MIHSLPKNTINQQFYDIGSWGILFLFLFCQFVVISSCDQVATNVANHDQDSIIIVEGVERSLVQSIDRKSMLRVMSHFLNEVVALSYEKSNEEAQKYIDLKYQEYMDFVMKL